MSSADVTNLILRTALKDRAAFDQLYRHVGAKLFGVCLRILKDRAEAEEALQEVFVKIWMQADRYAVSDLSPLTWLAAVARHHAIDRVRARRSVESIDDNAMQIADSAPGPEMQALASDQRNRIERCLGELDGNRSAAVRGAYMDGDSYAILSERHGVPLNTIRTWLRRSLMTLRECLER